ncbi:ATP-binding protein, partial [Acidobacteriota bacterium]
MQLEPITVCPVSQFGSDVNGRYRILCEWSIPNEEDLLAAFNDFPFDAGRLVFYFGRLTAARRRALTRLCRKTRRSFIVLDDIALIYLCTKRGSKLRLLFECLLPFTHNSPYSMSSSLLPPEMFYGRTRQIEALTTSDATGSCLLYGGRQIGKTVLLRHVERLFNQNRDKKHIARFIDLKVKGIGSARPLDDLWAVVAYELAQLDLIEEEKIPAQVTQDWLFAKIKSWLDGDVQRRVLLLLDEADLFLESDGKDTEEGREPFSRCALIRGFMEQTERRFKVVFSGLHNVQRATQVANNPLAQ